MPAPDPAPLPFLPQDEPPPPPEEDRFAFKREEGQAWFWNELLLLEFELLIGLPGGAPLLHSPLVLLELLLSLPHPPVLEVSLLLLLLAPHPLSRLSLLVSLPLPHALSLLVVSLLLLLSLLLLSQEEEEEGSSADLFLDCGCGGRFSRIT